MRFFKPIMAMRKLDLGYGLLSVALLTALPLSASAQSWSGYGRDAQHSAVGGIGSQIPQKIRWSQPIDDNPSKDGRGDLAIHYGSPLVTRSNTVMVPVKSSSLNGQYVVKAYRGSTGALLWTMGTNYVSPPNHNWVPPVGLTLTPADKAVIIPGPGGSILVRKFPDNVSLAKPVQQAFYGPYSSVYDNSIFITTPLTSDKLGNIYFGYYSTAAALPSGLARISNTGVGSWISAATLSGDTAMTKVAYNCAPALSPDGSKVYVGVNASDGSGRLCVASSSLQAPLNNHSVLLKDPHNNQNAFVTDDSTSSPTVGPDGDVYYGVLESNNPSHNDRGWLLHFDSTLATLKIPGSFGWDDTASIVPANIVPSYKGTSSYLVLTKYNNYADFGTNYGNGENYLAVLDPFVSGQDYALNADKSKTILSPVLVMNPVLLILGASQNVDPITGIRNLPGVREWCINSAAIDTVNKCAVVNSEDGQVYRWSFIDNTLSAGRYLAPPTGEPYTPTVIGPDGAIYAINNSKLFCCVAN